MTQDVISNQVDYMTEDPVGDLLPQVEQKYRTRFFIGAGYPNTYYFFLNVTVPPFNKLAARQAVNVGEAAPDVAPLGVAHVDDIAGLIGALLARDGAGINPRMALPQRVGPSALEVHRRHGRATYHNNDKLPACVSFCC